MKLSNKEWGQLDNVEAVVLLADGFEEIEGLTVVDLLRRADINTVTATITDEILIQGAHGIETYADAYINDFSIDDEKDMTGNIIVLPGGSVGTENLKNSEAVKDMCLKAYEKGAYVAAICAAPTALAKFGLLDNRTATCYPGCEVQFPSSTTASTETVVKDDRIITSRGFGTAIDFALKIITELRSAELAEKLAKAIVYK